MTTKSKINLTISPQYIEILEKAQLLYYRQGRKKVSKSQLIEEAIGYAFRDKRKIIRENMKKHQQRFQYWKDQLEIMDEKGENE